MPTAKKSASSFTPDTSSFRQAIDEYTRGRVTVTNPTIRDYVMHYGSNREVAMRLAEARGIKFNSAMRQVQRMMKNPDVKVRTETKQALGSLSATTSPAHIEIQGYYNVSDYWRYGKFSHTVSQSEMSSIISATRQYGNDVGVARFMQAYGISDFTPMLATSDLEISITEV